MRKNKQIMSTEKNNITEKLKGEILCGMLLLWKKKNVHTIIIIKAC